MILVLVYSIRIIAELLFILTGYSEFICGLCVLIRVVTIVIDAVLIFIHFILLFLLVHPGIRGFGVFCSVVFFFVFIPLDIYFAYIFFGYTVHVNKRYDRTFRGPNGKLFGNTQNVQPVQPDTVVVVQNVQNAPAHDQEVPGTASQRMFYPNAGQPIHDETHQIQDSSNNLISRSFNENDNKATKDNVVGIESQTLVKRDDQTEDPNLYRRDEEDP